MRFRLRGKSRLRFIYRLRKFLTSASTLAFFVTLALTLALSTGCGYRFLGRSISDTQSRKIAVPTFHNDTFDPLIGKKVTGFIKEEIVSNGGFQLINDPSLADLTLTGRITSFSLAPISSSNNRATEYRVSITIDVGLTGKNNKPGLTDKANIWTEKGREVTAEYFVTDDITANSTAENRAIEEAAKLFAEDLVSQILEGL
ncbi:MAG: LptE family protein [Nitrospirae bacterium]|nr:LptE family protein [Nitrospirota bacterium]